MPDYTVQLQRADGQILESPYRVGWDPEKVGSDEVARACAAEATCGSGRNADGSFKMPHAGLTAVLQS